MSWNWVIIWIVAILLGVLIGSLIPIPTQAQAKSFNVYETPGACVYMAGYGANPMIFVVPKSIAGVC